MSTPTEPADTHKTGDGKSEVTSNTAWSALVVLILGLLGLGHEFEIL